LPVMGRAYLSLGSNLGDRMEALNRAMALIGQRCGTIVTKSSVYETAAWGLADQPAFLNMAIGVDTPDLPVDLMARLLAIETTLGRKRMEQWGPRTIDIDILFYDDMVLDLPNLTIPHPYLQDRRFVLAPMNEIAPGLIHPVFKNTISELLRLCPDKLAVIKYMN